MEYNNQEIFYEKKRDPREHNVVEHIRTLEQRKAELPKVEDDHVCMTSLQKYVKGLEEEVAELKYDKLFREFKDALVVGGEIVVGCDADFETAVIIEKDTTLNLNGKTVTIAEDTVGDGVFHVTGGTTIIEGNGCINGVGKNDYNMAIWADGGNVIINGGTITNKGATAEVDPAHFDLIYAKNGATVEINSGFFRCETPKWTLNNNDSAPGTIIVKGGTFVDYDPSHSETEPGGPVSFVAEGYKVVAETQDNGEVWYTVVAE